MEKNIKKLVMSGVFLALCMVPLLIGHIPEIGRALADAYPVLICALPAAGSGGSRWALSRRL